MLRYGKAGSAAMLAGAFLAGMAVAQFASNEAAQAQSASLPGIFEPGAQLLSPTGPITVQEVMGDWIRLRSRHPLAKNDGDQWMYVPSLAGTWLVDSTPDVKE